MEFQAYRSTVFLSRESYINAISPLEHTSLEPNPNLKDHKSMKEVGSRLQWQSSKTPCIGDEAAAALHSIKSRSLPSIRTTCKQVVPGAYLCQSSGAFSQTQNVPTQSSTSSPLAEGTSKIPQHWAHRSTSPGFDSSGLPGTCITLLHRGSRRQSFSMLLWAWINLPRCYE